MALLRLASLPQSTRLKPSYPAMGLLGLLFVAACAKPADTLPVFPVAGEVWYEGKPAPGAVVILHPVVSAGGVPRPRGQADSQGKFSLTTYLAGDGAPAGDYVATVEWKRVDDHPEQGADLLPAVYGDARGSKLRTTIVAGENAPIVFRLVAKP